MRHRDPSAPISTRRDVLIRESRDEDDAPLRRLAQLDSAVIGPGPFVVAETGERIVAALSLSDGSLVADPFARTADLVDLLRVRAAQLGPPRERDGRRGALRRALGGSREHVFAPAA